MSDKDEFITPSLVEYADTLTQAIIESSKAYRPDFRFILIGSEPVEDIDGASIASLGTNMSPNDVLAFLGGIYNGLKAQLVSGNMSGIKIQTYRKPKNEN